MANKYLTIRNAIKALVEGVDGVGVVHGRSRLATNWKKYIERFYFAETGRIQGAEITRTGFSEHRAGAYLRHHKFVIRVFLGFQDEAATEETFQPLIDEICEAFRTAGPEASWLYGDGDNPANSPAQAPVIDERMFGDVLCHYAEIHLSVTERINP
jgi:hypothetical protein